MSSKFLAAIIVIELVILGLLSYEVATFEPMHCNNYPQPIMFESQPSELEQLWRRMLPYLDPPAIEITVKDRTLHYDYANCTDCILPTPAGE